MKIPTRRESMIRLTANQEQASFYEEGDLPAKKSGFSCCCCSSALGAALCAIFSLFFLAGCAVTIFLLYPRIPFVVFRDLTYLNGQPIVANSLESNSQETNGLLTIPLGFNLDIDSENYYDISIIEAEVSGTIKDIQVGEGIIKEPLVIKSKDKSHIVFPFSLQFNTTDTSTGNLQLLKTLNESCHTEASRQKPISIDYLGKMTLKVLSWTEKAPDVHKSIDFNCPWDLNTVLPEQTKLALTAAIGRR